MVLHCVCPRTVTLHSGDDVAGELSSASPPVTYEFLLDFAVIISSAVTVQHHTLHCNGEALGQAHRFCWGISGSARRGRAPTSRPTSPVTSC